MKTKFIVFMVMLLIMFSIGTLFVSASIRSSSDIDPNVSSALQTFERAKNADIIIHLYNGTPEYWATKGYTMKESVEKGTIGNYYITIKNDSVNGKYLYNENIQMAFEQNVTDYEKEFAKQCLNFTPILNEIGKGTKLINYYYMDNTSSQGGLYCCIETSNGDYVFFTRNEAYNNNAKYLIPYEDYQDVAKKIEEEIQERLYDENGEVRKGGIISYDFTRDLLKEYEYITEEMTLITPICIVSAVLFLIMIPTIILLRRKKHIQNQNI